MTTYPGLPGPVVCDFLSREASREIYAPGTEFQIGKIEMVSNTGTYIDSPFHRYPDGIDIAELDLASLAELDDDTSTGERPVHGTLLGGGAPIVEHLRALEQLPAAGFRFFAVPPKVRGMGAFPVRARAACRLAPSE